MFSKHCNFYLCYEFLAMAPRKGTLTRLQGQEQTCSSFKYFKASITIVVGGIDIDIAFFVKLRKFIEENWMAWFCSMERGGAWTHKHFEMDVKRTCSSL